MRIVCLVNNWVGWQVLEALREDGAEIVALVLHPKEKQSFAEEILSAAKLPAERIFCATQLSDPETLKALCALKPDLGLSIFWGSILRKPFLDMLPRGCLNLHPALLPYNRGAYPNVWSIIDGTPAGVTLHYVDEKVDTGDIVAQLSVPVSPDDTGKALYWRLEQACVKLFRQTWPQIKAGTLNRQPQEPHAGTHHRVKDVEKVDAIDLERMYRGRELIDLLRARTFPPHKGAYIEVDGKRIYLSLKLQVEGQEEE